MIIRTHGIEKEYYELLKNNGNEIIDLTCPFVSKIHGLSPVDEDSKFIVRNRIYIIPKVNDCQGKKGFAVSAGAEPDEKFPRGAVD